MGSSPLGVRDLPFPRLSAFGYWCFLLGGVFLCGALLLFDAARGGWFMYPPLTSNYQPGTGADMWLLEFSFIEIAAIAAFGRRIAHEGIAAPFTSPASVRTRSARKRKGADAALAR